MSGRTCARGLGHGVDQRRAVLQLQRGRGADVAAGGQAHVRHQHVGPGLGHRHGLRRLEHVGRGQQVHAGRGADQLDLEPVAHAGLLQALAERAVDQAHGREVLDAGEAHVPELAQEMLAQHERVGAVDAGQHGRAGRHRQHLAAHLDHDLVGVAVGQQAGQRAAPGHAVAAGIVDHDQVDAARLLAAGGQAGTGAAADDRLAALRHGLEALQQLGAGKPGHQTAISRNAATSAAAKAGSLMACGSREQPALRCLLDGGLERFEQRGVRLRVVERLAGHVDQRHAALGSRNRTGPSHAFSRWPIQRPIARVLLGRRPHQRDLGIVDIEVPVLEPLRHRVQRRRN